jgi:UPF0755 protein
MGEPEAPPSAWIPRRLLLTVGGVLLGLFTLVQSWWVVVPAPALRTGPLVVEIAPQKGVLQIARHLDGAGAIRSPLGFSILSVLRGSARSLRAGEYEIPQNATTLTILELLESGKVKPHVVLLPEGGTVRELARLLEAEQLARAEEILRFARDPGFLRTLGVEAESLEGYLFPDTYYFFKGLAPQEILARMVHRLREMLTPEILAQTHASGLTLHQLLTLASIIEKEAVIPEERPLISAVFWNRLKKGMPLQADPTVKYARGDNQALTRADLQLDSPFNTYRNTGLPPGPIASPGKAAIVAVLNPAKVSYLYFVSMDGRRHFFSSTLDQHNSAVARYRLARIQ